MDLALTPSQYDFVYSKARHPAFVGSWAVGKSMTAIDRAIIYSKGIPDNLGVIFRKTARSLHDSTLKDFETMTGLKVNANRDYTYANKSTIMFRHIDEIGMINQQNLNLGWFYIEQGEELGMNSQPFFMLFGRLRRTVNPTEEFLRLNLPLRSGWVIANAGDMWMRPLWKDGKLKDAMTPEIAEMLKEERCKQFSELIESKTFDEENRGHLKADFKASLKIMQKVNPELYRQYVENDWDVTTRNVIFPHGLIQHMGSRHGMLARHSANAGVSVDPSGEGADQNVFMAGRGGDVIDIYEETTMPPSQKAIKAVEMCKAVNGYWVLTDCDGLGIETYQELRKLPKDYLQGIQLIKFHGSAPSQLAEGDRVYYLNMRTEAAFMSKKRGWQGNAGVNHTDEQLIEDLKADEYEIKGGKLRLIPKKDIKEVLGRSPGRGDCWKMLQWGFEQKYRDMTYNEEKFKLPRYAINTNESVDIRRPRHLPEFARRD